MTNFMTTRATLARLLATENLIVEHSHEAETASFNTEDRVLTLPILKTENENVYNMFVAHECAHALWTPNNWATQVPNNIPFDFVNVIEDVRIERLIQDKFPGLRRDFTKGYDELDDKDFFGIQEKDLSELSLIDRINLHFKLGVRALIPFSEEEMTYVRAVDEADTFDKVCLVAAMIRDYVGQPKKRENESDGGEKAAETAGSGDKDGKNDSQDGENSDKKGERSSGMNTDSDKEDNDSSSDSSPSDESGSSADLSDMGQANGGEFESETQREFDKQLRDISRDQYGTPIAYITPPKAKLSDVVISVDDLRQSFDIRPDFIHYNRDDFDKFLSSIKRDVTFMVQQFEMRKSADAYSRQQTNRTGVLDTQQLHNYRLTDDIFLRQTITPDGKNHGMMMIVDWSGSMSTEIVSVVKQLITLVQFCRKVQIPFDVYTFTSCNASSDDTPHPNNEIAVNNINLVQVVTSTSKRRDIDTDLFNLFCQARALGSCHVPTGAYSSILDMGGTPLNNTMFLVPQLVKQFRERTKAQKVSLCMLTDGESSPLYYWQERNSYGDGGTFYRPSYAYYEKIMLRDGSSVIPLCDDISVAAETGLIARYLHDKIEDFSIFNIFIGSQKVCDRYLRANHATLDEKLFRKENACSVSVPTGWPLISVISPKAFGEAQEEIAVESGAGKAQIRTALKKFLASKQSSKNLLTRIVASFA